MKIIYNFIIKTIIITLITAAATSSIAAANDNKDIETIARAIAFIDNWPAGPTHMAIIYDPENAESTAHAKYIQNRAKGVGSKVKLHGKITKLSDLANTQAPIIFLTKGTEAAYDRAIQKAIANKGITVSTEDTCLEKGCVLIVQSQPRVNITINNEAAHLTGAKFATAFRMMVNQH